MALGSINQHRNHQRQEIARQHAGNAGYRGAERPADADFPDALRGGVRGQPQQSEAGEK